MIIYSRQQTPPAQKFVLEIKVDDEGGFFIDAYENDYKAPKDGAAPAGEPKNEGEEPPGGYFTSMVALKRSRKKAPVPAGGAADEEDADS